MPDYAANERDRGQAYRYLFNMRQGKTEELIKEIGPALFDEFRLVGYIKEGMSGKWVERWQLTKFGENQISTYINIGLI